MTIFGDADDDDAFDANDHEVDWSRVDEVAAEYERIEAIEDDAERLEAARRYTAELGGRAPEVDG